MNITLTNISDGVVKASWDPASLPKNTSQLQFRKLSNVSEGNKGIGFDLLQTAQSIKSGVAHLVVDPSEGLLIVCAAALTSEQTGEYGYTDIEGSNVAAILPLS